MSEKLAIDGGTPVSKSLIRIDNCEIGEEEIAVTIDVLKSKNLWLYNGKRIKEFQQNFANYVGVKHAIAMCNGTVTMEAALAAAKIKPGDEVITTPYTFIATQLAILRQNAVPIFADIDPHTYNISPESVREVITDRTKAILAVDIFGTPADMDSLMRIARKNGLVLIDDCAQSLGAEYKGRKVGSLGDMCSFSFTAPKAITSGGEGGMVTTDDDEYAKQLSLIYAFGYDRTSVLRGKTFDLRHIVLGWNGRITEMQAAIGNVQLKKLDEFVRIRRENADYLTRRLKKIDGLTLPYVKGDFRHAFWQYTVRMDEKTVGVSRDRFREALIAEGVDTHIYYPIPNYRQPVFLELRGHGDSTCPFRCPLNKSSVDYSKVSLPVVERVCKEVFTIPVHNSLKKEELESVATAVEKVSDYYTSNR